MVYIVWFISDGIILCKSICFISYGNQRIFQLFGELYLFTSNGIYMFLFHAETNAFSIA